MVKERLTVLVKLNMNCDKAKLLDFCGYEFCPKIRKAFLNV